VARKAQRLRLRRHFGTPFLAFFVSIFIVFFSSVALGEDPVVTLEPGYGSTADTYRLVVTISGKNSSRLSKPTFEDSDNFEISQIGTNTRNQFVNGEQSFQISFSYLVRVKREIPPGEYPLPAGSVKIDGKEVTLQSAKLTILPAGTNEKPRAENAAPLPASPGGLDFTQVIDNEEPYVGEQVLYRAEIAASIPVSRASFGDVAFDGFWHESFGKNQERRRVIGSTAVYGMLDAIFATKPGKIEIGPRTLDAEVRVPRPQRRRNLDFFEDLFDDLDAFDSFQTITRHLTAQSLQLDVKPLPPPPHSDVNYIPVGDIQISSRVDPKRIKQGESVNLTIEIFGDGNLRPLELPKPLGGESGDFKTYSDQPKVEVSPVRDRIFFKKTFQLALLPQKAGKLMLPTFEFLTFDPKTAQYKTLRTEAATLEVLPGAENEKLIIKGGAAEQTTEAGNKQDVTILRQDLYPLHLGKASYEPSSRDNSSNDLYILLLPPILSALLAFAAKRKREFELEPSRVRRRNAAQAARAKISKIDGPNLSEDYLQVLRVYLGDRLGLPGESLTSVDAPSRLVSHGLPEKLVAPTADLLNRLQRAVYGGTVGNASDAKAEIRDEISSLIDEIERHASK